MSTQEAEMTSRRRHPSSPAAPPLEVDDLLSEILLRLPPQPSSLPRASLVCKRWHGLVSDRVFLRRFRLHHRRNPPLLGSFDIGHRPICFVPTMDPPNRVPHHPFSLEFDDGAEAQFHFLGCRHGLVLIFHASMDRLLVWDPVTGYKHSFSVPEGFDRPNTSAHGAVVRTAGDAEHFQVVMVGIVQQKQHAPARASARVYASETGMWGNLISVPLTPKASDSMTLLPSIVNVEVPSVLLVGDSLHWLLGSLNILQFDLDTQRLAVIPMPVDLHADTNSQFCLMRADGGGLGCLLLSKCSFLSSKCSAQLWKRKTDCDGVASWVLGRTIEVDKLLSLNSVRERANLELVGFAEENNVVLLWTAIGLFTVQLDSFQFKKLFETDFICRYLPFESVCTVGTSVGGGHEGAELLHNT